MATVTTCDKCEEVVNGKVYNLTIGEFKADLCMQCAAEVQNYIETSTD